MNAKIDDLVPVVRDAAKRAIADLIARGVPYVVTSTLRTLGEQEALYAQGRKSTDEVNAKRAAAGMYPISAGENSYTVTDCDGTTHKSKHQGGRALDVVPSEGGRPVWPEWNDPRWKDIASSFKAEGFEWGGDWEDFPDRPHYQMRG